MKKVISLLMLISSILLSQVQAQVSELSSLVDKPDLKGAIFLTASNQGISCNGSSIQLKTNLDENDSFTWSHPELLDDPSSPNPVINISEDVQLVLTVKSTSGSNETIERSIQLRSERISANFDFAPREGSAPLTVVFSNQSAGAISFEWLIGNEKILEESPENTFVAAGKYPISLVAVGQWGCRDTTRVREIQIIEEAEFFIPTTFTPNFDGLNETFGVVAKNVAEFKCEIFSAYGELVKVIESPADEWDGSINGYPAPSGSYVYKIRYKDLAGDSKKILGSVELRR